MGVIIGISLGFTEEDESSLAIRRYYVEGVRAAGGIPVLLPPQLEQRELDQFRGTLSGILLSGGGDVDPIFFNQEPEPDLRRIDPLRDIFEIKLTRWALQLKLPLFGICRGMQLINIACSGSIIQHLGDNMIKHDQQAPFWYPTHQVNIRTDSYLFNILNRDRIRVNSYHHQAVGRLGEGIKVVAEAPDGVVEAIIREDHPFALGVQWHPERMFSNDPLQMRLFEELIRAGERYGK